MVGRLQLLPLSEQLKAVLRNHQLVELIFRAHDFLVAQNSEQFVWGRIDLLVEAAE